ncbi:uncharacterized protein LOC120687711 isoform X2 [Panicum virgatum]|uniref:uncharacterized protein LOC120687711 isoform X2 n=1 Tax=Panicum virgatum TaxID=38727 RepID=UPI0019D55482|nr:uncharacterized protein LOC120687711 isoform X2 [Panicum virgatum]
MALASSWFSSIVCIVRDIISFPLQKRLAVIWEGPLGTDSSHMCYRSPMALRGGGYDPGSPPGSNQNEHLGPCSDGKGPSAREVVCPRTARPTERRASCRVWTRNEAKSYSAHRVRRLLSLPPHPIRPSSSSTSPMATAVRAVSLPLPRRASSSAPVAAARRPGSPLLRRRHCAVAPVAAACSPAPPRQLDNEEGGSGPGRRLVLVAGAAAAAAFISRPNPAAFAAESKKGFLPVVDKKAGYSFLYPFGWQEVAVQGQDKVYKDVIEPLESVSINSIPTSKEDIRDLGPPDKVAEALIKKVLAPPTQKTKLIEAKEMERTPDGHKPASRLNTTRKINSNINYSHSAQPNDWL